MCDISFIVPSISSPVIGPVTVLARILEQRYAVEIVGPDFGEGVCPMYRNSYNYKAVSVPRLYRFPDYIWQSRRLGRALGGRVIVAVKARASSLPVAMFEKKRRGAKVAVYLDEWDGALSVELSGVEYMLRLIKHFHHPMDDIYMPLVERLIPAADEVFSTTTFLQKKFGGHIIHMGVDCDFFRPQDHVRTMALKRAMGLHNKKVIAFGGVVRPHKGVELILQAVEHLNDPALVLLVIGPETDHVKTMRQNSRWYPFLHCTGSVPKEEMPSYLDLADMIILPLQNTLLAQSQMPCKVFEAMAMAKPIIATNVSDLPRILEGCGLIVPPNDAHGLSGMMQYVLDNPDRAAAMGSAARIKCLEQFSREQTERKLMQIIGRLL
ncbi:MAG: glycosyltransferase [Kiritimatiellia bacterium]